MNQLNNSSFKAATTVKTEAYKGYESLDIQSKLERQLGPEYVSTRPGAGGTQVSYIEGWKAINLANQVFGFNGWCSEVKTINIDFLDERQSKFSVGLSVVVRVTLKDGSFHEDVGYGSADNMRTKAQAFEKAKKEAMTDGMKRALRCFGNAMGNCLYDKEYLSRISGVKCSPPDFDESNLFRYTDGPSRATTIAGANLGVMKQLPEAPQSATRPKAEPLHPVNKYPSPQALQQASKSSIPEKRATAVTQSTNKRREVDYNFDDSLTFSDDINLESEDFNDEVNELLNTKLKTPAADENSEPTHTELEQTSNGDHITNETSSRVDVADMNPPSEPIGFFKARVAEELQKNSGSVTSAHAFNPQFISPSIRRTVDPTKSTPIKRSEAQPKSAVRYDNPKLIPNRQIGKPRVYPPPKKAKEVTEADGFESNS